MGHRALLEHSPDYDMSVIIHALIAQTSGKLWLQKYLLLKITCQELLRRKIKLFFIYKCEPIAQRLYSSKHSLTTLP